MTCKKCKQAISLTGGAYVCDDNGTTAAGLSYCPPDPDYPGRFGLHVPERKAA